MAFATILLPRGSQWRDRDGDKPQMLARECPFYRV
jgi:hypothetical protein